MDNLIPRFVDLHAQAHSLLDQDRVHDAKQKYMEVLNAYHEIQKSPLEKAHKDIAYDQVTSLFSRVNEAKQRTKVPYNIIAAAVLVIAFSILVVIKPSIVGLIGYDDIYRQPINLFIEESGLEELKLDEQPISLALSGNVEGNAKVFYKNGDKLELIVDTSKIKGSNFTNVCEETCTIKANSNLVTLFVDLENQSTLTLTEISYNIIEKSNTPPKWRMSKTDFAAKLNKMTTLDLNDYFEDSEGDELVFLSTRDEGIDVRVQDSYVDLVPRTKGTKKLIFIASDLRTVTRVPVSIEVSD